MNEDETAVMRWLTCFGKDAKAALGRLLQSPEPLHPQIRKALADALSNGAMLELTLVRRPRRGRQRAGLAALREQLRLVRLIKEEEAAGVKPYLAPEEAAKKAKVSRAAMYAAKTVITRVSEVNDPEWQARQASDNPDDW
ncbi:MAG: hypothetical protein ACR2KT_15735 [Methylocella sp.]